MVQECVSCLLILRFVTEEERTLVCEYYSKQLLNRFLGRIWQFSCLYLFILIEVESLRIVVLMHMEMCVCVYMYILMLNINFFG